MNYLLAFLFGGVICAIGQVILDKSKLTQADLMVILVIFGSLASALGLYKPLVDMFGAGASAPVSNFGHVLTQGVIEGYQENGFFGVLQGGMAKAAAVLGASIIFGFFAGLLFRPKG
ncbi:MAG: SpoVA/SpoVAEb family sporulation membrane protein [Firmicutes bacterium]|nr:SpoVA/SpoVAEb family sporulation membrane protein [Bacillota bacterium]MDD4263262.1 SpoVA/SpoVAEb family sporulation membrane protein [Bacillota bacterium]MDD4693124.1 SpoVA/SpoVAEb family sporulation membrane protein [Bacillota bacterium]